MNLSNSWPKIACIAACLMAMPAQAAQPEDIKAITQQLRCLTCPNETIAESSAPMALDVKNFINAQLDKGATADAIIADLTERYGEQIRYRPTTQSHNMILWLTPLLCVAIGVAAFARLFIKRAKT